MMKNKIILFALMLFSCSVMFAQIPPGGGGPDAPGTGYGPSKPTPIDTNQIILVIAGILLIAGVITYKKLSVKKVA